MIQLIFIYVFIGTIILTISFLLWNRKLIAKSFERTIVKHVNIDQSRVVHIRDGYQVSTQSLEMYNSRGGADKMLKLMDREARQRMMEALEHCGVIQSWETDQLSPGATPHYQKHFLLEALKPRK